MQVIDKINFIYIQINFSDVSREAIVSINLVLCFVSTLFVRKSQLHVTW